MRKDLTIEPFDYLILGFGHFGKRAFEKIKDWYTGKRILCVDRDERMFQEGCCKDFIMGSAIDVLSQFMKEEFDFWIIPAVPIHVAFLWLFEELKKSYRVRREKIVWDFDLPNKFLSEDGYNLYSSYASFICPDDCEEPDDYCTVTKKPRKTPLYKVLGELSCPGCHVFSVQSHQIGPGVGGYRAKTLRSLYESVRPLYGTIIISTACKCHGVTSALFKEDL